MTSKDIIRRLKKEGWELFHTKGSHHQFKNEMTGVKVTIPHPKKDFPKGTLRSIFKQVGWQWKGEHK